MSFKNIPSGEKPREKLMQNGPRSLADSELLAIILQTGSKKEDVLTMSSNLLKRSNLKRLSRASTGSLQKNLGIGAAKACQIAACFELARRLAQFKEKTIEIKKAKDVADLLVPEMQALEKEHLKVMFLNTRKRILRTETIFIGSLNESVIHPREIFQRALEENAAAIILAHNHPSGDPAPSDADIEATRQIIKVGELVDIPVLDHIVIGENKYFSMREKGLI